MSKKRICQSLDRLFSRFTGIKEMLPVLRIAHNIVMTQTISTNGQYLFYASDYIKTLDDDELDAVVMHEILHVLKGHIYVTNNDLVIWNIACDFDVNNDLIAFGMKLPVGMLLSNRFDGMLAEDIYKVVYPWTRFKAINGSINRKN